MNEALICAAGRYRVDAAHDEVHLRQVGRQQECHHTLGRRTCIAARDGDGDGKK